MTSCVNSYPTKLRTRPMQRSSLTTINARRMATSIRCRYALSSSRRSNVAHRLSSAKDPHNELQHQNILITNGNLQATVDQFHLESVCQVRSILARCHEILLAYRNENRPRPHRDEKFLASWNGLMISGLARAACALQQGHYVRLAEGAMHFIGTHLVDPSSKRLLRACYIDQVTQNIEYT